MICLEICDDLSLTPFSQRGTIIDSFHYRGNSALLQIEIRLWISDLVVLPADWISSAIMCSLPGDFLHLIPKLKYAWSIILLRPLLNGMCFALPWERCLSLV